MRRSVLSWNAKWVALLAATAGCGSPRPSQEPLGWGPLPEGARTAESVRPRPRRDLQARKQNAKRDEQTITADAGAAPVSSDGPTPTGSVEVSQARADKVQPSSSEKGSAPSAKSFDGQYRGEDQAVYRIRGMPERTERDPNARTTARATSDKTVDFVLVDSSNGKDICTLSSTLKDGTAALTPGQRCFEQSGENVSIGAVVTRGVATLDGNRLRLQVQLDVEMHLGDTEATGTLEYRFDGTRL